MVIKRNGVAFISLHDCVIEFSQPTNLSIGNNNSNSKRQTVEASQTIAGDGVAFNSNTLNSTVRGLDIEDHEFTHPPTPTHTHPHIPPTPPHPPSSSSIIIIVIVIVIVTVITIIVIMNSPWPSFTRCCCCLFVIESRCVLTMLLWPPQMKAQHIYMGVVQNTFSRTALNRSANRVATAVPQWAIAEGFVLRWSDHIHKI